MTSRTRWLRRDSALGSSLNLILAALVVAVLALGGVAWFESRALQSQVDRWWWIETVDEARITLLRAKADYGADRNASARREVEAAFERLERRIGDDAAVGAGRGLVSSLAQSAAHARAVFDAAHAATERSERALARLERSVASLRGLTGDEAARVRTASLQSSRAYAALAARQLQKTEQLQRLVTAVSAANRVRQRLEAEARSATALSGDQIRLDMSGLPLECADDPNRPICDPSPARLFHALTQLRSAPAGDGTRQALERAAWAAEGYIRAAERAYAVLSAALEASIDRASAERALFATIHQRESALSRFTHFLGELQQLVEMLRRAPESELEAVHARQRGMYSTLAPRARNLFSARATSPQTARSVEQSLSELSAAWREAFAAVVSHRSDTQVMEDTLLRMGAQMSMATERIRDETSKWLGVFATMLSIALVGVVLAVVVTVCLVVIRFTRPMAKVTEAILKLADGDVGDAPARRSGGRGFIKLFDAIETLRRAHRERIALLRAAAKSDLRLERKRAEAGRLEAALRAEQEKIGFFRKVISLVSHELRTPLAVIDGNARSIGRKLGVEDRDATQGRVETIRRSVTRLTGLMDTFLLSSKLEAGQFDYSPKTHDLGALIEDVCKLQEQAVKTHRVELEIGPGLDAYFGDERLLRQAIANLVSNGVKYSPKANKIVVQANASDDGVKISVRDQGVGVPDSEISKLGSQFYRASTHGGIMGTGVGLHLVKSVTELHGGRMDVDSVVGEGSTFHISLPPRAAERQSSPPDAASRAEAASEAAAAEPALT